MSGDTWGARLRRGIAFVGAAALVVTALVWGGSTVTAEAAEAEGCSYGVGGPNADTICWLDLSEVDGAAALTGQHMTVSLDAGITLSFDIKFTPQTQTSGGISVSDRGITAQSVPVWSGAVIGNQVYTGTEGEPALYIDREEVPEGWVDEARESGIVELTNIEVQQDGVVRTSGYSLVMADAERSNSNEGFTWRSDQPIELIANVPAVVDGVDYRHAGTPSRDSAPTR